LGAAVGYDFNLPKFAHYIAGFQNKEGVNAGGFFGDAGRTVATLDTTVNAAATLFILQQHYDKEFFFERFFSFFSLLLLFSFSLFFSLWSFFFFFFFLFFFGRV